MKRIEERVMRGMIGVCLCTMLFVLPAAGCASDSGGQTRVFPISPGGPEWRGGKPVVQILAPESRRGAARTIEDNTSISISAVVDEAVYFTVDAPYAGPDGKPVGLKRMHFVVGGHKGDGTIGRVRVNGAERLADGEPATRFGERALLDVEEGWVWVSDRAPMDRVSSRGDDPAGEAVTLGVVAQPQGTEVNMDDPAVGWSSLSLLRARWSWAGAIGTEFVYRVNPRPSRLHGAAFETVYALGKGTSISNLVIENGEPGMKCRSVSKGTQRRTTINNRVGSSSSNDGDGFLRDVLSEVNAIEATAETF